MAKRKRLQDVYRFLGFLPCPKVRGLFGEGPPRYNVPERRRRVAADECSQGDTGMKTALLALVAVTATAVAFAEDDPAKKDLKALVGTWQYTSQEADGKATDQENLKAVTVTVTPDGKWQAQHEGKPFLEGTVRLDPSKKPKAADWAITTEGDLKGKTALGIYAVDEDTWKL
jgi:uncharacterized protein (TIGR03067 family)